jgi:hypothetical protein
MATYNVSSDNELVSALRSADGGDQIRLSSGTYSLSARNLDYSSEVTITGSGAQFDRINLTNASNLTFDGVDMVASGGVGKPFVFRQTSNVTVRNATVDGVTEGGYGDGHGLWIAHGDDFTLENSTIKDFNVGLYVLSVNGLDIRNNEVSNIARDAMILGRIHDASIADNDISLHTKNGTKHTDGIQLWNTGGNDPASNVSITGNYIATNNSASHGIYAGNGNGNGNTSTHFQDIEIRGNTIVSAQLSGIAVGETSGLDIVGNVVLQDTDFRSGSEIRTPVIRVAGESRDVTITGNTTHETPAASGDNWQELRSGIPGEWNVSNNRIVPIGTSAANAPRASGAPDDDDAPSPSPTTPTVPDDDVADDDVAGVGGGNGRAETFRFDGDKVRGTDTVDGFDFGDNDTLVLIDYGRGTFAGQGGGNKLDVSSDGSFVRINSVADLEELAANSAGIDLRAGANDALVLDISQNGGADHSIQIAGLADDFFG